MRTEYKKKLYLLSYHPVFYPHQFDIKLVIFHPKFWNWTQIDTDKY